MSVIGTVNSSENLTSQEKVIVVLGDSLSAGYGVTMEEAWPFLLEKNIILRSAINLSAEKYHMLL